MRIAIATTSREKIQGITNGFKNFFGKDIEVIFQKTESGVPEQPFNAETYTGARNRVDNFKSFSSGEYEFIVSCEAGIEEFSDLYFNVQVICVFDVKKQCYYYGKSMGWQIPSDDIKVIKESNLDIYLKNKGFFSIEELLGFDNTRNEAISQATYLALASTRLL